MPAGRAVVKYHGSMGPVPRKEAHVAFLTGQAPVIVATEAFGMGIDKRVTTLSPLDPLPPALLLLP